MDFSSLGLSQSVLDGVEALGYSVPTPVQQQAIPEALAGRDVLGCAQTGTGKTAAFMLPILDRLPAEGVLRALVVTPTRELAGQVGLVAKTAGEKTGHHVAVVHGGVKYGPQIEAFKRGVDVLVATPGRLLDLQSRGVINFKDIQILVLDEADRMLDMGFWPDVRRIVSMLPEERQTLLFSATLSAEVLRMVNTALKDPVRVETAPASTPAEKVRQVLYPVSSMQKPDLLVALLEHEHLDRVLVFCGTKDRADRVHAVLSRAGIGVVVMHSDRSQQQRERALKGFRDGKYRVLVATDIVARGIDVEEISHVVNYDLPHSADDYVHRVGRTARAGASGSAISFVSVEDLDRLREIEMAIGYTIPTEDLEGFEYAERVVPRQDRAARQKPRTLFSGGVLGRPRGAGRRRR